MWMGGALWRVREVRLLLLSFFCMFGRSSLQELFFFVLFFFSSFLVRHMVCVYGLDGLRDGN